MTTITFAAIRAVLDDLENAVELTGAEVLALVSQAKSISELRGMIEDARTQKGKSASITQHDLIAALFDQSGDNSMLSEMLSLESTKPTGAWGKSNGGVSASHLNVDANMQTYAPAIPADYWRNLREAVSGHMIPPALLTAIFCRESNHGRSLDKNGYGDRGHAYGVGQVDVRYHIPDTSAGPYSVNHMRQCVEIWEEFYRLVSKKHKWEQKYLVKGATVAYNSGAGNVQTIENMDAGTTGNDYGADVLARAQYYHVLQPWAE
jgi:hypothetical protein